MVTVFCAAAICPAALCEKTDVWSVASEVPVEQLDQAFGLPQDTAKTLLSSALSGESVFGLLDAPERLVQALLGAAAALRGMLLRLFAAAVCCALLQRFRDAWGGSASSVGLWAMRLFAAQEIVRHLAAVCMKARQTVFGAAKTMQALFPPLLTLLTAVGGTGSAAMLQPALTATGSGVLFLCEKVCLPLTAGFAALKLVDALTDGWSLFRAGDLCRKAANFVMAASLTVFTGVMGVRGFTAAARDGAALRAAKFAMDSFVPEVGGLLSDTAETVAAGSLLVKNALGATGAALLCAWLALPLAEIFASALVFRLAAALTEPFSECALCACFDAAGEAAGMLTACVLTTGAMFLLLIAQAVAAGNIVVMMT